MVNKHAYLNILLLLHSTFMLCVVKIPLKGDVGVRASWKNHGIVFLNFCGNPDYCFIKSIEHVW